MASTPSPEAKAKAKIFTLPREIVEEILIFSALYGFPSVIAQFSRTCRYFHRLVYRSTDNHLWREVFLTTFDDPRLVLGRIKGATTFSPGNTTMQGYSVAGEVDFDWEREFIHRIDAVRVMKKYTDIDLEGGLNIIETGSGHAQDCSPLSMALRTLISVLETAHPFPAQCRHDAAEVALTFPPILAAHASSSLTNEYISSNASWVDRVVRLRCPRALVNRFLANLSQGQKVRREAETVVHEALAWEASEEGQLFHKLVFLNGSVPFTSVLTSSTPPTPPAGQELSPELTTAMAFARSRVYNLRYLTPDRCWGPFLPAGEGATSKSAMTDGASFPDFQEVSNDILGLGDVPGSTGHSIPIVTSDEQVDERITALMTFSAGVGEDDDYVPNDGGDSDSDDDEYDEDDIRVILNNGRLPDPTFIPPKPHQVVPDYTFLSAARVLVEVNLRQVLIHEISVAEGLEGWHLDMNSVVDAFGSLQFLRMGGAPGFWENWVVKKDGEEIVPAVEDGGDDVSFAADPIGVTTVTEKQSGKVKLTGRGSGKARETDEYEGWDWAGAAGEWKRAVCWLDYRDLLLHNLTGFPSESLEETVRVFPMTLRVSGYSPPPDPDPEPESTLNMTSTASPKCALESLVYTLPVIHLEGESRGSDVDATVLRHVKGTVRMITDGAVRWTLTSSFPGENTPEWVTESIQVGAIGSVVGIIGMWTGAEHAPTDPLGPTWAWKVG